MVLAPIHVSILIALANYYVLTRVLLQRLCMPEGVDRDGRRMRKHLARLLRDGFVNKTHAQVVFLDRNGAPSHVYYPSRKGCEYLAVELKENRYRSVCTLTPDWRNLNHWVGVSEFHIELAKALEQQKDVQLESWLNEWDIANYDERDPAKRYKLFTEIRRQPRLVCAPDGAWLFSYCGFRKVFYLEVDRATSGIHQISTSKTPGFAALAVEALHVRHFPSTNVEDFRVLCVSPSVARRDALQKAISTKAGSHLWRFVAWPDIRTESLLHEPILLDNEGRMVPMVKRLEGAVPCQA